MMPYDGKPTAPLDADNKKLVQINNIKSQYLALPRGRESIKETDRRFFQYAYQNFLRVPIADVPSAAVAVNEAGRLRECEASTEEDKQSKKSRRDDGGRS